jgi:hypothetical protein
VPVSFTNVDVTIRWREDETTNWWSNALGWTTGTSNSYQVQTIHPAWADNTTGSLRYVYNVNGREWISADPTAQVLTYDSTWWGTGVNPPPAPAISQEEADRRLRETRERQHRNAIRRKRAVRKGQRLLLTVLSETQKWEYAKQGTFTVCGADGEMYVLRKGGTVHQLGKNGVPEWSHCIHLPYSYIDEDTLVSIKLMLETDPLNFHRIANTTKLLKSNANVSNLPAEMAARAAALRGGMNSVNEHMARLSAAVAAARPSFDRLAQAAQYADYARELEGQVVAEEVGLVLPLRAQQQYVAEALGHAETISGDPVQYDGEALEAVVAA